MQPIPSHLTQYPWYASHLAWLVSNGWDVPHNPGDAAPVQADLAGQDLSGANLITAYLYRAILTSCDLSGADLSGTFLAEVDASSASFVGATVAGVNLTRMKVKK